MADEIDGRILHWLSRDAGMTSAQLGEKIGLSPSAAHRRVKLLEEAGLIQGYRAVLSDAARGSPSTVFVAVTLKDQRQETLLRFEQAIARGPEVAECHLMSGESDYLLKVLIRTGESYEHIHRDVLAALPGVQRLVSQFSIRTIVSRV